MSVDRYLAFMDLGRINIILSEVPRVTCVGITKAMFKSRDGLVPIAQLIAASGQSLGPPAMPGIIAQLQSVEGLLRDRQAESTAPAYTESFL